MLTEKELMYMDRVLNKFEDEVDFMSVADLKSLKTAIKRDLYETRVRDFYYHVVDCMPQSAPRDENGNISEEDLATEERAWDTFYQQCWRIEFNGKYVCIENSAYIYQAMCEMLLEYLQHEI